MILIIVFVVALLLSGCMMYSMVQIRQNYMKINQLEALSTYQLTTEDVKDIIAEEEKKKDKSKRKIKDT